MMQCETAHTCLMCMSLPSCSACQDNERWCTAASILTVQYRTHWFVTFIYLFICICMWQRFCAIINTLQCMMQCNSQVQSKGTIHRLQSVICPLLLAVQCSSSLHPLSYSHNLTDIPLLVDPSCLAHICTIPGAQCAVTIIKKNKNRFIS